MDPAIWRCSATVRITISPDLKRGRVVSLGSYGSDDNKNALASRSMFRKSSDSHPKAKVCRTWRLTDSSDIYGQSTGLSGIAVVVAAAFWTLLWGPVGLLLSTPLTMCLVVMGRHVEHLQFLEVILGDQPALAPEESFYQRMLAGDPDEAARQAEEFLADKSLAAFYDEVAIGGLTLAQLDVNRGVLGHEHRVLIKEAVDGVVDNLADHAPWPIPKEGENRGGLMPQIFPSEQLPPPWQGTAVLCVAGRGSLDEATASLLAQLLHKHGIGARVVPSDAVSVPNLFSLEVTGVQMAFLCYLEPGSFSNPRYLVRRLRRKLPRATIVAGFWTLKREEAEERSALRARQEINAQFGG
jgi:hypothetical protein